MREPFVIGQYYHIYNRGTDKRIIFMDKFDLERFLQSMEEFNSVEPIGSIYENRFKKDNKLGAPSAKLVDIICYSLSPNHFHFILSPLVENGIEKFMQKLGSGYTMHFNEKYERSGVLFQGRYKSILIKTDDYLIYLSAYINLNNKIHFSVNEKNNSQNFEKNKNKQLFYKSSWEEFLGENKESLCNKSIVLDRYKNIEEYKEFAESVAQRVIEKRIDKKINLENDLLIEKL